MVERADESAPAVVDRPLALPIAEAATVIALIALGLTVKGIADRKARQWIQDVGAGLCPWDHRPITRLQGEDWECSVKPRTHNSKAFWRYLLS